MKALTISQPFADLIATNGKFVENRAWECLYRGPLAIHAGKGTQYLTRKELARHPTGCIIAVCQVEGCIHVPSAREDLRLGRRHGRYSPEALKVILDHEHTEGPFGIVLGSIVRLDDPIPINGALGLWNVPDDIATKLSDAWKVGF